MRKGWSRKDEQFIRDNYGAMTQRELANDLGRTYAAVERKIARMSLSKPKINIIKDEQMKFDVNDFVEFFNKYKNIEVPKLQTIKSLNKVEEDIVIVTSDEHIGTINHYTDNNSGKSFETYNYNIFKSKLVYFISTIKRLHSLFAPSYKFPTLNWFRLGDSITEDTIFPGQIWETEFTKGEQIFLSVNYAIEFITNMLEIFDKINIVGVCGNHGRTTEKPISEPLSNNLEWVCYKILATIIENNKDLRDRVKVILPTTFYQYYDIRGHKYLLMHGDTIRKQAAHSNLDLFRTAQNLYIEIGKYEVGMCGHFHTSTKEQLNEHLIFLTNGCWVDKDAYALRVLKRISTPSQWIFGVSNKRAKTFPSEEIDMSNSNIKII